MLTLTRIGSTRVYSAAPGDGFLAFLAAAEPPNSDPVTVRKFWEDAAYKGWFAVLAQAPPDLPQFAQALQDSGVLRPPDHASFAWLRYIAATQQIEIIKLLAVSGGPPVVVPADTDIKFRNYGFRIHASSPVTLSSDGDSFAFGYPPVKGMPVPSGEQLTLTFDGARRFCFQSEGLIGDFSADAATGWDVALRYYSGPGQLRFWRYPVFDNPPAGCQHLFRMNWDLLAPLDPARTYLDFTQAAYELKTTGGPEPIASIEPVKFDGVFTSSLRTLVGGRIGLRPILTGRPSPARLVFESVPDTAGQENRFNLTPSGDFAVELPAGGTKELLCGLAGTEFITVQPGHILSFHPHQAGYAPQFPILKSAGGGTAVLLESRYKTAWVSSSSDAVYYSQPVDAALFTPSSSGGAGIDVLRLFDSKAGPVAMGNPFPMAGYGGLSAFASSGDIAAFEAQILAPSRYQSIAGAMESWRQLTATEAPVLSTTPQGFLVTVEGTKWRDLWLARTRAENNLTTELQFAGELPDPLRRAFQSSELFLVISSKKNIGGFKNRIMIADWPFVVNLPDDSSEKFTNVLIVKFCAGSVVERVRDVTSWTSAADFNTNPNFTSSGILTFIEQAKAESPDVPALNPFVQLVQDPNWNGVLALRVDIELAAFPPDLKGLLGGMDLTRFYGHHFGLTLNFVKRSDQQSRSLDMPPDSSLFALIHYRDRYGEPSPTPQDPPSDFAVLPIATSRLLRGASESESFDYRVITLLVEFRNSEVVNFESRIILTISKLFGEAAALAVSPRTVFRNSLVFDGNRQVINKRASYSFRTSDEYRFLLEGTVVKYVQIRSAQFLTLSKEAKPNSAGPAETIRARFNLNGVLNFHSIPEFDAFSFGDEDDTATDLLTAGLQYNNLGIGMEFELPPGFPLRFALDPTAMSFDTGSSQARELSVFRKMPLTMSALLTGSADKAVKDLGYVAVKVQELSELGSIGKDWFGLAFGLNLGTLGALASNAGFSATLLAAWSPGGPPNPVQILLNLPGLGAGKKTLSLQNILKLTIDDISMAPLRNAQKQIYAYVLKLRNIGLSLLGKKLPPSGVTDIALFSDFRKSGGGSSLSWYAAYYTAPPVLTPAPSEDAR